MNYETRFIAKTWEHHSSHSGYDQLVPILGSSIERLDVSSIRYTWIPGRLAVKLAKLSGVLGYDFNAFYHEWAAYKDMCRRRRPAIYHILYGDDSFRYLSRFPFSSRHRVVASYHLPSSDLTESIRDPSHLRSLSAVIVVSRSQFDYFRSKVEPERLFYVPHGVNTDVFAPSGNLELETTPKNKCLFVGMHKRDFQTLNRVIEIVSRGNDEVRFDIVTSQSQGQLVPSRDNVRIHCGVTEAKLVSLYRNATLLLQPLLECTANNAILEGMASGLPIVATDIGGVRDYVSYGCAALTAPGDAEAMAGATLRILADPQQQVRMAGAARSQALRFDWSHVAAEMRRVYEAVL